jgi:DNA modification methylase
VSTPAGQLPQGLAIEYLDPESLSPHPNNPRQHPGRQIRQLAANIARFGFLVPVLAEGDNQIIAGHARVEAAKRNRMTAVPVVRANHLDEAGKRAVMVADNRLTETSKWDDQLLGENLKILSDLGLSFEDEALGFDYGEIEQRILSIEDTDGGDEQADQLPEPAEDGPPVSREGDVWLCPGPNGIDGHEHRLVCGDSTEHATYQQLLGDDRASMIFTDAPYNLAAKDIGQVCDDQHGNFAMGSGEMSQKQFIEFLSTVIGHLCNASFPGSIHYLFMDWRHMQELLTAGLQHYNELKNLCVWVKDRPGMGTFYRSQHELVFVFKYGDSPHQNNFALGQHGRTRSNVWSFPSARNLNADDGDLDGNEALGAHPTIKPVRLIEEAILDCSRRGEIVLDPFLGSGSTLIACEKARRRCAGIELSPKYLDTAIRRWQQWTGCDAIHESTGQTFKHLADQRKEDNNDE